MMAGRNQHHIPRFLQRGFAVVGTGGHKIWRFDKERLPTAPRSIRSTACEDDFYSEASPTGQRTLDEEITDLEGPLAKGLSTLRAVPVGTVFESEAAAELVNHLAPRTAHVRQTIERGMRQLASGASELFTDSDRLKALMGIDQPRPNEVFRKHTNDLLQQHEAIASLGLPDHVIERIAFYIAKEQFESSVEGALPSFRNLFRNSMATSGGIAREGHNKGLGKQRDPNARRDFLRTLKWCNVSAPPEGAILPDCVALAIDHAGFAAPLMLSDVEETVAVIMPLCSKSLLLGVVDDRALSPGFTYNREAARSSHRFFLADNNSTSVQALQLMIDERSLNLVDIAVQQAFKEFLPSVPGKAIDPDDDEPRLDSETTELETSAPWSYQLSCIDCADEATANAISVSIVQLTDAFGKSLSIRRLEGVTFAADYAAALAVIDRGRSGLAPPTTIDRSIGVGIAQTVNIIRDGRVMCRIVLDGAVAHALVSGDDRRVDWAIGVVARQLALVALTEIVDVTLPGVMLQPVREPLQGWLYGAVGTAIDGYTAAHICAGFGDPEEMAEGFRDLLAEALDRMRSTVLLARLVYRHTGELDELLGITVPLVRHVLLFAADLLGHCAALGIEPVPSQSALAAALDHAGLRLWLRRYHADLEAFRLRLGRWESFEEFSAFTLHVERLLWQLGMIPWNSDQGMRVEIPLASDAEALMAALEEE